MCAGENSAQYAYICSGFTLNCTLAAETRMHRGSTAKALFPTAASVAVAGIMRCDLIAFICASWSVTAYTQAADYYWTSVLITGVSSSKFETPKLTLRL